MKTGLLFLALLWTVPAQAEWKSLDAGLEYQRKAEPQVHLFRIDPARYRLDILTAKDFKVDALAADGYRERSGAVLVVNGGFFDEAFRPLGLLHRRGETINPLRDTSWGVFLLSGLEGSEAKIIPQSAWKKITDPVLTALQVGPRLVVDGKVPKFKEGLPARRSAICVTSDGWVEIALSETPLLLKEWANLLQKECPQALNLDGGGSSQMAISHANLSLKVEGLTNVPNAIAVFRK